MFKWIVLGTVVVLLVFIGYWSVTPEESNARVAQEIRENPGGERARRTMLITLADGRMYPVNYLREDDLVYMAIDGRWWREFVGEGQPVEMLIQGVQLSGHATTVLNDPQYTADVFSRLRPRAPAWLPAWLNGKLVVISRQGLQE